MASLAVADQGPWATMVVDNGSTDGSAAAIRAAFPAVDVIEARTNLGFTGGNNLAIGRAVAAGADMVLLLNNDTVIDPAAVRELVGAAAREPGFGILTPLTHYFDRPSEPWFAGSRLDLARGVAVHDNIRLRTCDSSVVPIPWATGCAMLIRRPLLDRLGGFDERFFLNWEDVDLSLRAVRLGCQIGLVPAARIYHKVGRAFANAGGTGGYYYVRNHLLFLSLHVDSHLRRRTVIRVATGHARRAVGGLFRREPHAVRSAWLVGRAIIDYVRGRFGRCSVGEEQLLK